MNKLRIVALLLTLLGILGAVSFVTGISNSLAMEEAKGWPTTTGTITHTRIDVDFHHGNNPYTSYEPELTYEYQVTDDFYSSTELGTFAASYTSYEMAQNFIDQHPIGSEVLVYYDPENPSDATLMPGSQGEWEGVALAGGLAMGSFLAAGWLWASKSEVGAVKLVTAPGTYRRPEWKSFSFLAFDSDEKQIWTGRPLKGAFLLTMGRISLSPYLLLFALGLSALIVGLVYGSSLMIAGAVLSLICGAMIALNILSRRWIFPCVEYFLTDKRVVATTGTRSTYYRCIELSDIYQVLVHYTFIDSIFHTGSLVFSCDIHGDIEGIKNPEEVRSLMVHAIESARRRP